LCLKSERDWFGRDKKQRHPGSAKICAAQIDGAGRRQAGGNETGGFKDRRTHEPRGQKNVENGETRSVIGRRQTVTGRNNEDTEDAGSAKE
jgi:hypothetical protein